MNGMKASDRIFAFLDLPEAEDGKAVVEEKEIRISMEKLCFSYEESREILRDVELENSPVPFVSSWVFPIRKIHDSRDSMGKIRDTKVRKVKRKRAYGIFLSLYPQ